MDLHCVKAGGLGALCCLAVFLYDPQDLVLLKRTRDLSACLGGNVGGGYRLHVRTCRLCGCSGMVQLDADAGAVFMDCLCQFEETGNVVVMINAQLCGSVGAFRRIYAGIFYHDQACAALGTLLIVINMEKTHLSALLTVVCSHGSHHDPVFQGHAANSERLKNMSVFFLHNNKSPVVNFKLPVSCRPAKK